MTNVDYAIDILISGATVVTMDRQRRIHNDGSIAIQDGRIVAVGPRPIVEFEHASPRRTIDGSKFVVTPGLINSHIHVTGEPLTKGLVPDNIGLQEWLSSWICQLYASHDEGDERLSAQLAAAEMLLTGTTTFLEAGTIWHLDAVVEALEDIGIRARVGRWTWDLPHEPTKFRQSTETAISRLEGQLSASRSRDHSRVGAWSIVLGRQGCSDALWIAAKQLADEYDVGLSFHVSAVADDVARSIENCGRRPIEHLADLGVLGSNVTMTHAVWVNENELDLLRQSGASVVHCPMTALKLAYGAGPAGLFPEMLDMHINVALGTDGANAGNSSDMLRAAYLAAGLFKDARRDASLIGATAALTMATVGGARALQLHEEIGSIEVGKKADLVLHDRHRPEWIPLLDVMNQIVYSADGRSVHTVIVDGKVVVSEGRILTIDQDDLYRRAQSAAESIVARTSLPNGARS